MDMGLVYSNEAAAAIPAAASNKPGRAEPIAWSTNAPHSLQRALKRKLI